MRGRLTTNKQYARDMSLLVLLVVVFSHVVNAVPSPIEVAPAKNLAPEYGKSSNMGRRHGNPADWWIYFMNYWNMQCLKKFSWSGKLFVLFQRTVMEKCPCTQNSDCIGHWRYLWRTQTWDWSSAHSESTFPRSTLLAKRYPASWQTFLLGVFLGPPSRPV